MTGHGTARLLMGVSAVVVLWCWPARDAAAASEANRIRIEYVAPTNPQHEHVYEFIRQRRVLERFQQFLGFVRLPQPLLLKTAGCDGESNAWYEPAEQAVTVCYEYLYDVDRNAPRETTPAGVTPADATLGPTVEVFLHEMGHAFFDMLKIPVLGREEDAADQVAAYILVSLGDDFARRTIAGVAYMYAQDAQRATLRQSSFANVHSLDAQRFYNVLCLAYGSNAALFADVVQKRYLPEDRADGCEGEFQQVRYAMQALFAPHIDRDLAQKAQAEQWLKP
jgi:Putative metallopeptidase